MKTKHNYDTRNEYEMDFPREPGGFESEDAVCRTCGGYGVLRQRVDAYGLVDFDPCKTCGGSGSAVSP